MPNGCLQHDWLQDLGAMETRHSHGPDFFVHAPFIRQLNIAGQITKHRIFLPAAREYKGYTFYISEHVVPSPVITFKSSCQAKLEHDLPFSCWNVVYTGKDYVQNTLNCHWPCWWSATTGCSAGWADFSYWLNILTKESQQISQVFYWN